MVVFKNISTTNFMKGNAYEGVPNTIHITLNYFQIHPITVHMNAFLAAVYVK